MILGGFVQTSVPFQQLPPGLGVGLTIGALQALVLRRYLALAWVWAVATGFGVAVAGNVADFVVHDTMGLEAGIYDSPLPEALAALSILGVTIGVCVGGAQWFVLYRSGYRASLWIPLSIAAIIAAIAVGDFVAVPGTTPSHVLRGLGGFILGCVIYAVLTGLLLSRIFCRNSVPPGRG